MAAARRGTKQKAGDVQRPSRRTRRKLRGSLESLPGMPVDILIEIMDYLTTPDILHLARTSKAFRAFLMSRSSNHIWRAARMNVALGFPDCPEHLSEPKYAHLAYDTYCDGCLENDVKTVFWALGVRYCLSCRNRLLVKCKLTTLCEWVETPGVLYSRDRTAQCHWHIRSDYAADLRVKYAAMKGQKALSRQEKVLKIMEWADECEKWYLTATNSRETDINERRSRSLHAIVEKLKTLGWGDELAHIAPSYKELSEYGPVKDSEDITERIWKSMQKGVVEHMESIKQRRIEREREALMERRCKLFVDVYEGWRKTRAGSRPLPYPIDLIMCRPEIQKLVNQDDSVTITSRRFEAFRKKHFAKWAREWTEGCRKQLRRMVLLFPELRDRIPASTDPLSLASVAFACRSCDTLIVEEGDERSLTRRSDALQHECLWPPVGSWDLKSKSLLERAAISVSEPTGIVFKRGVWSCNPLSVEHTRMDLLKRRCQVFGKLYRNWHKAHADRFALPLPIDLIMRRPEIREVIEKDDSVTVTFRDFDVFSKRFAAWAEDWAENCRKQLREIVLASPEFKDKIPEGTDPLSLASVAFTCSWCNIRFEGGGEGPFATLYPDVLQHLCLWPQMSLYDRANRNLVERAALAVSEPACNLFKSTRGAWSCGWLRIGASHRRLAEIIRMCGKDPMSTTREEMDAVDTRFYCNSCEQQRGWKCREVFVWSNTLAHDHHHHRQGKVKDSDDPLLPLEWRTVTDSEELALVTKLGARVHDFLEDPANWHPNVPGYHCYHCASGAMLEYEVMPHLSQRHGITEDAKALKDYYLTAGSLSMLEHSVVLHPPWALRIGMLQEHDSSPQWKAVQDGRAGVYNFESPIGALYNDMD